MSHCGLKASNYSYETLREPLPAPNTVWEKQNLQHRLLIDLQIKWREIDVKKTESKRATTRYCVVHSLVPRVEEKGPWERGCFAPRKLCSLK